MNWKQINRDSRVQQKGVYTDWKEQISEDCYNQCVYCSIHENPWGGIDHYHIDHFKPQSKFEELANVITNLYYACPICNKFKSDHWPNDSNDLEAICYPDPSDYNYSDLFIVNMTNYTLEGKHVSSKFLINRLYLNRPQLVYERREHFLKLKAESLINETRQLVTSCNDISLVKEALNIISEITNLLHSRGRIRPYKLVDIKKSRIRKRD